MNESVSRRKGVRSFETDLAGAIDSLDEVERRIEAVAPNVQLRNAATGLSLLVGALVVGIFESVGWDVVLLAVATIVISVAIPQLRLRKLREERRRLFDRIEGARGGAGGLVP